MNLYTKCLLLCLFTVNAVVNAQSGCPSINIEGAPSFTVAEGKDAVFSIAAFGKKIDTANFTYNWVVSAGTIVSGQGSKSIHVNTKGLKGQSLTVTVEVGGLPASCNTVNSSTIDIIAPEPAVKPKSKPGVKPVPKLKKG